MLHRPAPPLPGLRPWALGAIAAALGSCTAHPLVEPEPRPEQQTDHQYLVTPIRKVDILVMVDNSVSMMEEQANLARNFPALMAELEKIPGGLPDVHIGVISSDLGAGPTMITGCRPGGDRGIFQAKAGCGLEPGARFIVSREAGTRNNFTGSLAAVFQCIATLGVGGCGFEHQLQALRVALHEGITPENKGFLREDAYLSIIVVTDEDDCSAPPDSLLFGSPDYAGTEASFRCAREGHLCQGRTPPIDASFSAPLAECRSNEDGKLVKVREVVESIRELKKRPDMILVSGIFGWPLQPAGALYRYTRRSSSLVDYDHACAAAGGRATAAVRIKEFVDSFGANGQFFTICNDDFRPAMKKIGEKLADTVRRFCVQAPLVDTRPEPGLQADCVVADRTPTPTGGYRDDPLPPCGPAAPAGRACWRLVEEPACAASGHRVEVARTAAPPPGSQLSVKCLTCVDGDARCRRP